MVDAPRGPGTAADTRSLALPGGDTLTVAAFGAQALSWRAGGRERLYLSPLARLGGPGAVRGGVPICFPQFHTRGPGPRHGFARQRAWGWDDGACAADRLALVMQDDADTRRQWPHAFDARVSLTLRPGALEMALRVHNRGPEPLAFTGALHTYLAVDDIATARLDGLHEPLAGPAALDRVFARAPAGLVLRDGAQRLRIEQSEGWAHTVVWNPGAAGARALDDLPDADFARMLCVEAAQVFSPITVAPGTAWTGTQTLTLL